LSTGRPHCSQCPTAKLLQSVPSAVPVHSCVERGAGISNSCPHEVRRTLVSRFIPRVPKAYSAIGSSTHASSWYSYTASHLVAARCQGSHPRPTAYGADGSLHERRLAHPTPAPGTVVRAAAPRSPPSRSGPDVACMNASPGALPHLAKSGLRGRQHRLPR
jgi:hypothetical protein